MAKARKRPAEAWRYILASDRVLTPEQQSTFILRPMTHAERAAVRDALAPTQRRPDGSAVTLSRTRSQAYELCLSHIASIENFPAGAPRPWPLDREGRERYIEQIDDDEVLELGNEVFLKSSLLGEERDVVGNSSPPEATSVSGG